MFTARARGWCLLPDARDPRVLALRLESAGALEALAGRSRQLAQQMGMRPEHGDYLPHLTLWRGRGVRLPQGEPTPELILGFHSVALMASERTAEGASYRALWQGELKPAC